MHCALSTAHDIATTKMAVVLPASAKEHTRAAFAEQMPLFAIIMTQISWQLEKNKCDPEVCSGFSLRGCRVVELILLAVEALDGGCGTCGTVLRLSNCINDTESRLYLFILFILLFCHAQWITSKIKTIINRLINIKFKICTLLGRSHCGGEISEKPSLWGIEISAHGQFKY